MLRPLLVALILLAVPAFAQLVPEGATVEKVADGYKFTEGPAAGPDVVVDADALHAELHDTLLHHAARKASSHMDGDKHDDDDKHTAFYPAGSSAVMDGQFPSCHAPTSCGAKCSKVVDDALSKCVTWVDADQPSGTVREACASTLDHAKKTCEDELPGQVQTCYRAAAAGFQALLSGESE